jgi:hypothetical protein
MSDDTVQALREVDPHYGHGEGYTDGLARLLKKAADEIEQLRRPMMTSEDVRKCLSAACERAGSQLMFAKLHDLSQSYVCDVLACRREPGDAILAALSFSRVVRYQQIMQSPNRVKRVGHD